MSEIKVPLLLMPGLLCDAALWRHQLDTLADIAEITVADMTQDDTIEGMAERALAIMPDRFALAGLSMGGYTAQAVMRSAPERVMKLALLDTSARSDVPERSDQRRAWVADAKAGAFEEVVERHLPLYLPEHRRTNDPDLVNRVRQSAYGVGVDAYARQQNALIHRPDNRLNLPNIDCPTLVLCGRLDQTTTVEMHEEMAAAMPNSKFVIVENCGHLAPMDMPEAVSAVLRYWLAD